MLKGKKIILGVTASIAAYKAASFIRLLVKEGAEVQVVMTPLAKELITPLTLATLSKRPILVDFYNPENGDWNSHVDMGIWADLYIIAPATANTIGKMAHGICDNLLLTTYMSAKCKVMVAPAMDLDMYKHPANQKNLDILRSYGNMIVEPSSGELASGLVGKGRMEEPENILKHVKDFFLAQNILNNKKVLITAGPTYEAIDPVRFIGNHSSGKMGFALAEELAEKGASVTLVSGPTNLKAVHSNIETIKVTSAQEMYDASIKAFPQADVAVMAAAVADYTPVLSADNKLKRESDNLNIELKPTQDIAASLGKIKRSNQLLVGFALETENEVDNAKLKIQKKNLDFIVLNSLNDKGAGFNHDTNKITIVDKDNNIEEFELKHKSEVSKDIVAKLLKLI